MEEIWRDIKGYEGKYQISNTGNVKSLERTVWNGRGYRIVPEKILEGYDNGEGYLYVTLWKDGKDKKYRINRLVAQAFLENPNSLPEVNHKDEDKTNNRVENLEWCDRLYNLTYNGRAKKAGKKVAEKLKGRKQTEEHIKKRAEKLSKPVFSVDKESGLIMWWQSAYEAERQLGISQSNICACCIGKRKSAGGFYWHYADSEEVM